jgi:hypothetical protein
MKKAISAILLISAPILVPKAFAEERWRTHDKKGGYERTVRQDDGDRMKMYDSKGRHKRTFREDNSGRMKMYDPKGRFEGTVGQEDGGRMKMYEREGAELETQPIFPILDSGAAALC